MKREDFAVGGLPATLFGDRQDRGFLFVHGLHGNREEGARFAETAEAHRWQVLAVDLPGGGDVLPWEVVPALREAIAWMRLRWHRIAVRATSIGAYLSLLAFDGEGADRCLLVSPVLDMERMILGMLADRGISEAELAEKRQIRTPDGTLLSWAYLTWVRAHRIQACATSTDLLWGTADALIPQAEIDRFRAEHETVLTVIPDGEHWLHTPEQLEKVRLWEDRALSRERDDGNPSAIDDSRILPEQVRLETERLVIQPMDACRLAALEAQVRERDPELADAYREMLEGMRFHPAQALWYTAWEISLRGDGRMVGDACFKGFPACGMPEIGYGILDGSCGQGYATEAVRALCHWALGLPHTRGIEAETAPDNAASRRVLEKLGFTPTGEIGEEGPRWRLMPDDRTDRSDCCVPIF